MSRDNEGMRPTLARVFESLIEEERPMQVQHYQSRRSLRRACGSFEGQDTDYDSQVTCAKCKSIRARAARRRAA